MTAKRRQWLVAGGILLVAFAVRMIAIHLTFPEQFFFGKYLVLGQELLNNGLIADRPFSYSPIYVYFIALAKMVAGQALYPILVLQALIGAGSCLLIFRIGSRFLGERWAMAAAGVACFYRSFVLYDVSFLSDSLGLFLQLAVVDVLWREEREKNLGTYALAGALIGLCILQRPNSLLLLVLVILAMLARRIGRRELLKGAGAMAGAALLCTLPVVLQNMRLTGTPGVTASNPGYIFYSSNNGSAGGFRYSPPELYHRGAAFYAAEARRDRSGTVRLLSDAELSTVISGAIEGRPMTLDESSSYYLDFTRAHVARHPARYLGLLFHRLWLSFNAFEPHDVLPVFARREGVYGIARLGFGLIAPLGLLGILISLGRWREYLWLYMIGINQLAVLLIFYVVVRFRLSLEAVLLLTAVLAVRTIVEWVRKRRIGYLLVHAAILALLVGAVHFLPGETGDRAKSRDLDMLLEDARRLERLGKLDVATDRLVKLIDADTEELPRRAEAHELLAKLRVKSRNRSAVAEPPIRFDENAVIARLEARRAAGTATYQELRYEAHLQLQHGRWRMAEPSLEQASSRNRAEPMARYQLGRSRARLGRYDDAIPELLAAIDDGLLFTTRGMNGCYLLARSYRATGDDDQASRWMKQAARQSILTRWSPDDLQSQKLASELRGSPDWVDPVEFDALIPY